MKKQMNRSLSLLLVFIMLFSLLPVSVAAASSEEVTVRIIGQNSTILDTTVSINDISDCTVDSNDSSTGMNALDAIICATMKNGYAADSYSLAYNSNYGTYYINKLAGITPSGNDYLGTLAVSASETYDGNALSSHILASGDTYIVYYDRYTGGSSNYGYQSYAWFINKAVSGTTGSAVPVAVKTTAYDANFNIVPVTLPNTTIYATGPNLSEPAAVAVTDKEGCAYINFSEAGTYELSLSSEYTHAQCEVTITGDPVVLSDVSISVEDAGHEESVTNNVYGLKGCFLTLTDGLGNIESPCEISSGTYYFKLPDNTYSYYAGATGYQSASGNIVVSGTTNKTIPLYLLNGNTITVKPGNPANETVIVKNSSGIVQNAMSTLNGAYVYDLSNGNYSYIIKRSGYHSFFGNFNVNGSDMDITAEALTDVAESSAEWPAFRNFSNNMAIISSPTAQGSWQAEEKWSVSLGALSSYGTLSTSNIVLYDEYIYVATEHGLSKINQKNGKILTTTALSTGTGYVLQIAYGNGKIFVTTASGIDAFDALTMDRLWSAPISQYGNYMATTPILYDEASTTIYVGDYGDSNYTLGTYGGYSAIDAGNGTGKWIMYGGASDARYWAGGVIVGDYVVFGSDSGNLSSVKKDTVGFASPADTLSISDKIRSSVAYDGTYLYFTTKGGDICKASIDNGTGKLTLVNSRKFSSAGSSSTPLIYNGKIYLGGNDGVYVLNVNDLSQIYKYETSGAVQSSALLTTAYTGTLNVYFTVNSAQGEMLVLTDDGVKTACDMLSIPSHIQYCMNSLVADSDGTIYYTNDSGYIFAIENNNKSTVDKAKTTISVSPASIYNPETYTTTYPSITVKDSSGADVPTTVSGTYYLSCGDYTWTVSLSGYTTATGSFTVTADDVKNGSKSLSVSLSKPTPDPTSDIKVGVSVIGDKKDTWIDNVSISLEPDSSAWDAIKQALDDSGMSYVAKTTSMGIYISSVNGLAENDKGANSGWLYSVNGKAPNVGVSNYTLSDGDEIVLYYTVNYKEEDDYVSSISSDNTDIEAEISAVLDKNTGVASALLSGDELDRFNASIDSGDDAKGTKAVIYIKLPSGTNTLCLTVPHSTVKALGDTRNTSLSITSDMGDMTFDPEAIDKIYASSHDRDIKITISKADISTLSEEAKRLIGNRPVYKFIVMAGDQEISDFGKGIARISMPYTPGADEDINAVVLYYINDTGALQAVRGIFNKESKTMDFSTNHFSKYAIGYNKVSFNDVGKTAWYYNGVTFCAARGITGGTGDGKFMPDENLTRGQFIVMLMRAYGMEPEENPVDNFADAGNAYYTNYLAAAKHIGITKGTGDNMFAPENRISRQDMLTMLYRVLEKLGELPRKSTGKSAEGFTDVGNVADYAKKAVEIFIASGAVTGDNGRLEPDGSTSRAQMVKILYKLLSE